LRQKQKQSGVGGYRRESSSRTKEEKEKKRGKREVAVFLPTDA
jgi:hypothetical protein